nr:MAG TPA: hypothetical protein [Caudoviricetes sp.]
MLYYCFNQITVRYKQIRPALCFSLYLAYHLPLIIYKAARSSQNGAVKQPIYFLFFVYLF